MTASNTLDGKTVLVTGATGFLGGALVHRLVARGAHVKALARRPDRDAYIRDLEQVEIVMGDVTDAERMQEVLPGCEIVFHLAASTDANFDGQRQVNVQGTRHVAEAAAAHGVQRLVHVSTIAAYGYEIPEVVTEDTPHNLVIKEPYSLSKSEGEQALKDVADKHGLEYSIIRPGMIYGPRSPMWTEAMFEFATMKRTFFAGDGSGTTYPIYVDDVVDMLCVLATHPTAAGEAFNCTPREPITWYEFLNAYARLDQKELNLTQIPVWLIRLLARPGVWLMNRYNEEDITFTHRDATIMLDFLTNQHTYSMDKARRLLRWSPRTSFQSGIHETKPYLREKGLLD